MLRNLQASWSMNLTMGSISFCSKLATELFSVDTTAFLVYENVFEIGPNMGSVKMVQELAFSLR